uniref:Putative Erf family protein n=1 Tax=viral metagenome TaxID=1070528 RepID=A0A6M3LMB8_9ZZZZ
MEQSESIGALAKALSQAQGEMKPALMNASNPFLKNRYADLGSVIEAVRPILAKYSLAFTQHAESTLDRWVSVTTQIMHESGEWQRSSLGMLLVDVKGQSPAQAMGSQVTYMKRYGLTGVFGIYADEDTDGNVGTAPEQSARAAVEERRARQESAGRAAPITYEGRPTTSSEKDFQENVATHWIENPTTRAAFWAWTKNQLGLTEAQVHEALAVKHTADYPGTKAEAMELIIHYRDALLDAKQTAQEASRVNANQS